MFKVNDTLIGENLSVSRGKRAGRTVRAVQCGPYGAGRAVRAVQCRPYSAGRTVRAVQCRPYSAGRAVRAVQCRQRPVFVNYTLALALQLREIAR
jgi:ribosomal protein S17